MKARIRGLDEARSQLAELGEAIQYRVLRRALTAAGGVVKAKYIAGAKRVEDSGRLAESVRMHVTTSKSTGTITAHIRPAGNLVLVESKGPDGVKRMRRERASRYAHIVEYGSMHVGPRPFARPALDTTESQRAEAFTAEVDKGVAKAIKRAAKKAAKKG